MTQAPAIAAVVVYYRTPRAVERCLDALRQSIAPIAETIVVDNSSHEDGETPEPASQGVRWLISESNLGYGAAVNRGVASTTAPFVLVLNADVELEAGAPARLLQRLRAEDQAAVVGPRIYSADGSIELSARQFPTPLTGIAGRASRLTALLRKAGLTPPGLSGGTAQRAVTVDWVSGACFLVSRSDFEAIGGFDPGYWMYWEDADLGRRLRDNGRLSLFEPAAVARHATGSSGKSSRTIRAFHESAARYYTRHVARTPVAALAGRAALRVRMGMVLRRCGQR